MEGMHAIVNNINAQVIDSSFAPLNWGKVVERIGDSVEISSKLGFWTSKLGQSV